MKNNKVMNARIQYKLPFLEKKDLLHPFQDIRISEELDFSPAVFSISLSHKGRGDH
jgi:hypothetical protein